MDGRHFLCRLWRRKPDDRASPEGKQANLALLEAMHPPLVAGATTFPPQAGALRVLSNGAIFLQESIERFILSPGWGKVRRSRIRGSRAAANQQNAYHTI